MAGQDFFDPETLQGFLLTFNVYLIRVKVTLD